MSSRELSEFADIFHWAYKLRPDSRKLSWRIPFRKVVKGLQSIGGIAELARVDRKTVYRRKLKPGSPEALVFVIGAWQRGAARPLVTHVEAHNPFNFTPYLREVLDFARNNREHDGEVRTTWLDRADSLPALRRASGIRAVSWKDGPRKWHRKHRMGVWENPQHLTDEKRAEFAARKKAGTMFVYEPEGRVTVAMVCTALKWHRRKFYRWRKSLTVFERKLLDTALNPAESRAMRATGIRETRELEPGDLFLPADAVYEGLYQQIDGG